jgi:hypothetical protein
VKKRQNNIMKANLKEQAGFEVQNTTSRTEKKASKRSVPKYDTKKS